VVTNDRMAPTAEARPVAGTQFLCAGLLLVSVAAGLTIIAMSAISVDDQIRWGAIALAVFCAGLLPLMSVAAGYDGLGLASWRIGSWSLVWGSLAFGLATLSWFSPETEASSSALILPGSILRALWMIAVALAMLAVGYCVGPYRIAAHRARRATERLSRGFTDQIRGPLVPWVLLGVGLIAQFGFSALTGRFGYVGNVQASVSTASGYGQYLGIAGECVPLAVVAAAIRAYQIRTLWAGLTLLVLFVTAIVAGAVAGGKESFVVVILAVIIPHTVVRRRLPLGAIIAAVLFFLFIIIPFNQAYRLSARGPVTLSTSQAVAGAPAIASQVAATDISPTVFGESLSFLAVRIRTIDSPAIIMQRTPGEIPYANPADLLIAPVVDLIPRIVWAGKPLQTPGYQISQEYYNLPPTVYTSSDVTPEGDLFRRGGWFPLIIGMFLIGCVIRIIDEVADLRRGVHGAFLIILLFPGVVQAGTDCASLLAGIPGQVVLWLVVVALCFTRRADSVSSPS
jgi:hypothetical protein